MRFITTMLKSTPVSPNNSLVNLNSAMKKRRMSRQNSVPKLHFRGLRKDALQQQTNLCLASMTVR